MTEATNCMQLSELVNHIMQLNALVIHSLGAIKVYQDSTKIR